MVASSVFLVLFLPRVARAQALWGDLEVPGTAQGLRAIADIGSTDSRPAATVLIGIQRRVVDPSSLSADLPKKLGRYIDYVTALRAAVERLPGSLALPHGSSGQELRAYSDVSEMLGVQTQRVHGLWTASSVKDSADVEERSQWLRLNGINPVGLAEHLNQGPVMVSVPVTTLPLPLPSYWSRGFGSGKESLAHRLLTDPAALSIYVGLLGMDDRTLAFLAAHSEITDRFYQSAVTFGAYGDAIKIANGRVEVPGGDDAVEIWTDLVDAPPTQPAHFISNLLTRDKGRLAYFYSAVGKLDPSRQKFVLGGGRGVDPVRRVYDVFARFSPGWRADISPHANVWPNPGLVCALLPVDDKGHVGPDWWPAVMTAAFGSKLWLDTRPIAVDLAHRTPTDAEWVLPWIFENPDEAGSRFAALRLAQRRFSAVTEDSAVDLAVALRLSRDAPALAFSLDRLHIRDPAVSRVLSSAVAGLTEFAAEHGSWAPLRAWQGAFSLLEQSAVSRALPNEEVKTLVQSLARAVPVPVEGEDPLVAAAGLSRDGRVADWVLTVWLPAICGTVCGELPGEEVVFSHLVAVPVAPRSVDALGATFLYAPEAARITSAERLREINHGLTLNDLGTLRMARLALERGTERADRLRLLADDLERIARSALANLSPSEASRVAWEALGEAAASLRVMSDRGEFNRQSTAVPAVVAAIDAATAEVMPKIAYAIAGSSTLSDPERWRGLPDDHDFGKKSLGDCPRCPWLPPVVTFDDGLRVSGSMIGLDLALSPLKLRQVNPPKILNGSLMRSLEPYTSAIGLLALDPSLDLLDSTAAAVAEAQRLGRSTVDSWIAGVSVDRDLARRSGLSGSRTNVLAWLVAKGRGAEVLSMLTATDWYRLGAAGPLPDVWGGLAAEIDGCICTELLPSASMETWEDAPNLLMNALSTNVLLDLTRVLHDAGLPVWLVGPLRPAAFGGVVGALAETPYSRSDDWEAFAFARRLDAETIRSYLSSLRFQGVLVPRDR